MYNIKSIFLFKFKIQCKRGSFLCKIMHSLYNPRQCVTIKFRQRCTHIIEVIFFGGQKLTRIIAYRVHWQYMLRPGVIFLLKHVKLYCWHENTRVCCVGSVCLLRDVVIRASFAPTFEWQHSVAKLYRVAEFQFWFRG